MIVPFVLELRKRSLKVGVQELIALARAMGLGLHQNSLDEFYYVARSILIHDESKFDDFDQVFSNYFKDIPYRSQETLDQLLDWLQNPLPRPELSAEELAELKELDLQELRRLFEERLREQKERHDGGGYWIGTGGRSPFGTGGVFPNGMSLGSNPSGPSSLGRSSLRSADARRYRGYRQDLVLDVRQIEVALRKLRSFDRDHPHKELDLGATIDLTARNFGDLELVFQKQRRPNTRVILLMDVGGSMDPFSTMVSQLFSAAQRATHWKELRTYYFHNCVYGRVFRTEGFRDPLLLSDLFRECDSRYKVIFVGDASMAPYELMGESWAELEEDRVSALEWLLKIRAHFTKSVWLNPGARSTWDGDTVEVISRIVPMFPLTIEGLGEALTWI